MSDDLDRPKTPEPPKEIRALERLAARLDDGLLPLDPLIGLVPLAGDIITGVVGLSVVLTAIRHRVPWPVVVEMCLNLVADTVVGSIPVVGDIADFFFRANKRNVRLLLEHHDPSKPPRWW